MASKISKKRKKILILFSVIILIFSIVAGSFTLYFGLGKIRYFIHKIEYKLNPANFPNLSTKVEFEIYGIDISHHNDRIDWALVRDKGRINGKPISFVFIKATEGKNFVDDRFLDNFKAAKKEDFLCGAYHFYQPEINSLEQFENFKRNVKLEKGDLPPVLDVEIRGNLSFSRYAEGILNLLQLMENHYGIKPLLYTSPSLYAPLMKYEKIKSYPLWLSAFSQNSAIRFENDYSFLQYTDKGKVAGIKYDVDLNGFKGDKIKFQNHIIK